MMKHEDYTIGWICALEETELPAAESMFDEVHPPLWQDREDENIYRLGKIGQHNVVIACISAGRYGIGAAAVVALHMSRTFKSLRFRFLVGIGGGVPTSLHEIRLGDVVVSQPTANDPGVIQYDLGKVLSDGSFKEKGYLNAPPTVLLNAIGALKAKHQMADSAISQHLDHMHKRYPKMKNQFAYQGKDYDHLLSKSSTDDQKELQDRQLRPRIHYGLIASGNRVIASVEERNKLCISRDILCFEMEAAGLMNDFPCLVIRGISDYADSAKTDQWQPYAAAVAAAYAKELLEFIPIDSAHETLPIRNNNPSSQASKTEIIPKQLFTVPFSKDEDFISRTDVLTKIRHLSKTTRRMALYGIGGIGKSQIAIEFCYQFQRENPQSHIIWIHSSSNARYVQDYKDVATSQKIPGYDDPQENPVELVHQWLNSDESRKWLLVLDNIDNLENLDEAVSQNDPRSSRQALKLPRHTRGTVLLTTRDRLIGERIFGWKNCVNVPYMTPDEADRLFKSQVEEDPLENAEDIRTLLESLDYLPLAITQAAAFIQQIGISVAAYNDMIERHELTLEELFGEYLGDPKRDHQSESSIVKSWAISFEQIRSQQSRAADLLCLMSMLDRQKIQEHLLRNGQDREVDFKKALGTLKAFSLINPEREEHSYSIHRLVQVITKEWLRVKNERENWEQQAIRVISTAFPFGEYENWSTCELLLPHAFAVLKYPFLDESAAEYATLMESKARFDCTQGRFVESEEGYSHALEIRKKIYGKDHPTTLTNILNLASAYWNLGRWDEAEELEVGVLETRKKNFGEDHLLILNSMANLAVTYNDLGRWDEAEKIGVKVLETRKKKLGNDHPDTLTSMSILASTYWQLGRWDNAEELLLEVIETRRKILGEDHPDTLNSISNLAVTYEDQKRWQEAEKLTVLVTETRKRRLGENHPDTLLSMANLAVIFRSTGRRAEAITLMRNVAEMSYSKLGNNHDETLERFRYLRNWSHDNDEDLEPRQ